MEKHQDNGFSILHRLESPVHDVQGFETRTPPSSLIGGSSTLQPWEHAYMVKHNVQSTHWTETW